MRDSHDRVQASWAHFCRWRQCFHLFLFSKCPLKVSSVLCDAPVDPRDPCVRVARESSLPLGLPAIGLVHRPFRLTQALLPKGTRKPRCRLEDLSPGGARPRSPQAAQGASPASGRLLPFGLDVPLQTVIISEKRRLTLIVNHFLNHNFVISI